MKIFCFCSTNMRHRQFMIWDSETSFQDMSQPAMNSKSYSFLIEIQERKIETYEIFIKEQMQCLGLKRWKWPIWKRSLNWFSHVHFSAKATNDGWPHEQKWDIDIILPPTLHCCKARDSDTRWIHQSWIYMFLQFLITWEVLSLNNFFQTYTNWGERTLLFGWK